MCGCVVGRQQILMDLCVSHFSGLVHPTSALLGLPYHSQLKSTTEGDCEQKVIYSLRTGKGQEMARC